MKERIWHDEVRFRAILPIKIVFMNPSMVSKCMRQKSILKGSNIKINRDLTVMQRANIKKVYDELHNR